MLSIELTMSKMDKIYPMFDPCLIKSMYNITVVYFYLRPNRSMTPQDYATSFRGPVDDGSAELTEWT